MLTQVHRPTQQRAAKAAKVAASPQIKQGVTNWPAASVWLRQQNIGFPGASPFPSIQAKLTIGQPGDRYEQEADRIADQVVEKIGNGKTETESSGGVRNPSIEQGGGSPRGMPGAVQRQCAECEEKEKEKTLQTKPLAAEITPLVQRQEAPGAKKEEEPSGEAPEPEETVQEKTDSTFPIQRSREEGEDVPEQEEQEEPSSLQTKAESPGAGTASSSLTARLQATKGGGQPLMPHTRGQMEGAFGVDFSRVRIHTDASAVGMNRELRAQAFTHGRDIYFGAGRFQPETTEGRRLLAHELVHVGQQRGIKDFAFCDQIQNSIQKYSIKDCKRKHFFAASFAIDDAIKGAYKTVSAILAKPRSQKAQNALTKYFGKSGAKNASYIAYRLMLIRHGLKSATFECENPGSWLYNYFCPSSTYGYVRATHYFGIGAIHLCQPQFHSLNKKQRICTIVHEGAHRYVNRTDIGGKGYYDHNCNQTSKTEGLSDTQRLWNADSYGCLVYSLI